MNPPILKKIVFTLFVASFLIFLLSSFCLAKEQELEVTYPEIGDIKPPKTTAIGLPEYVKYIFNFSIWIAGFVAFGALVYGGVRHLTSAGNPTATKDANEQIFAGILGLIIIISAYTILVNINPQLVILREPGLEERRKAEKKPGVVLCLTVEDDKEKKEKCSAAYPRGEYASLGELNNKGDKLFVKFNNSEGLEYGLVLHEDENLMGDCAVCLSGDCRSEIAKIGGDGVSSITVFLQGKGGGEVTAYRHIEFNKDSEVDEYYTFGVGEYRNLHDLKFINCVGRGGYGCDLGDRISSIKVADNCLAILYRDPEFKGGCDIFFADDPDLRTDYIRTKASSLKVLPGK